MEGIVESWNEVQTESCHYYLIPELLQYPKRQCPE